MASKSSSRQLTQLAYLQTRPPKFQRIHNIVEQMSSLRADETAVRSLGRLLDEFDRHAMWEDTALILTTDHGFLLGEHDFWAKNRMNLYDEIVHIPMFAHDPRRPRGGQRVHVALTAEEGLE